MIFSTWTSRAAVAAAVAVLATAGTTFAADPNADLQSEVAALKARLAELERRENENWLTEERASQIKALVNDVIADARQRGQFLDGDTKVGYKDGFFIESGPNFKLVIGGFVQARYTYARVNAYNGRSISGGKSDPGDATGFDIRRARISVAGYAFSKDITYKLEGDFYGASTGAFTVTDAWLGYRVNDALKFRVGSFKVPFAKAELTSDTALSVMERPLVLGPFNPSRALGLSVFGDIIKDKATYEININDGSNTNTLRRVTTVGTSNNLDNRLAFYGRLQYVGNGTIKDFADEPDLRKDTSEFAWMVGFAAGYESQNNSASAFPSPQGTVGGTGLSTNDSAGFSNLSALNGDVYRATVDYSAKYQGWSFVTAAYFQQFNHNSTVPQLTDTSGFQHGYYAQASYMLIPKKLEVVGRVEALLTEDGPNIGEVYVIGANYYMFGHSAKLMADVSYTPEAPYTDAGGGFYQNTKDIIGRLQFQVKF